MTMTSKPTGPSINRHRSRQDYSTPAAFMAAVQNRFGLVSFDLAASSTNAVCPRYYSLAEDSLRQDWSQLQGRLWLNPPFSDIAPWAKKCADTSVLGPVILFLVPASVGSKWFAEHVHNRARVYFLRPRLSFDGKDPFPKDCVLCVYGAGQRGYETWDWKSEALV